MRRYIDLHCDTLTELTDHETLEQNHKSITLEGLQKAEVLIQCCSIFIATGRTEQGKRHQTIENEVNRIYGNYQRELGAHPERLQQILGFEDIGRCLREDKTGILLTIEDGGVLEGQSERLQQMYQKGVRLITLLWNDENEIGYPNSQNPEIMKKGLKPVGRELVEEMDACGIVVDVSHLSDGGFQDVAEYFRQKRRPFVASHSNAREVTNHPRNMTDQMIRSLAECGGVMGLNFCPGFLNEAEGMKGSSKIEDMVRHMKHIKNVGGSEILALGSDFDGIEGELEIAGPESMSKLWDALHKNGFSEEDLDKMAYKNALRVFHEIL